MSAAHVDFTYHFTYEPLPELVGVARTKVAAICVVHSLDDFGPVLATSELLTNAMRFTACHPGCAVELVVYVGDALMSVQVSDPEFCVPDLESVAPPDDEVESGRGLMLVKCVADGLEVIRVNDGRKAVRAWFARGPREIA